MSETIMVRRDPALLPHPGAPITPLPPCARFVLRLGQAEGLGIMQAGGFPLSGGINSALGSATRFSTRLGPDEWLLVAASGEGVPEAVAADLAGRFHSLVDVSHRNVAIALHTPHAQAVLNAGVPLDLSDAAFPDGSATRTLLGKAEIVLVRMDGVYRVECWRSFAPYVHAFLEEAAREFSAH